MVHKFESCDHEDTCSGRQEYCLEETEVLDAYARKALGAIERLIYSAPKHSTFERDAQFAEREISFWNVGTKTYETELPLTETTLSLHHVMNKSFGTESYLMTDSWKPLRPDIVGSIVTKYYLEVAPGHRVEGSIEAFDFEKDCRLMRPMTEYDYRQIAEQLTIAERHLAVKAS